MKNSEIKPTWYARLSLTGKRFNVVPRGLLLAAVVVAFVALYQVARIDSAADQAVAQAKQEAEETPPATATAVATQASALQAAQTTPQTAGQIREAVRGSAAPPVADAGYSRLYTVNDDLAYVYTVRAGEYWSLIADRFLLRNDLLIRTNTELWQLREEALQPGDQLVIPGLNADAMVPTISYSVREGDRWERIADSFSVSYLDLILDNFDLWAQRGIDIRQGDQIMLTFLPPEIAAGASPGRAGATPFLAPSHASGMNRMGRTEAPASASGAYEVQPGDSWESISAATGIDIQAIQAANSEYAERALEPGDMLRISWILHASLTLHQAERSGIRGAAELGVLSQEELAALAARGLSVYKEQYCGICHQLDAAGTRGMFGPSHNGLASLAADRLEDSAYGGAATDIYAYLYESIIEPDVYLVEGYALSPHRMPTYQHIPEQDLEALIVFLADQ